MHVAADQFRPVHIERGVRFLRVGMVRDPVGVERQLFSGVFLQIKSLLALQLALLWAVSDGWSGIRASLPLLGAGALLSALACAALFAAWVRADCRRRGEDEVLWPLVVVLTTPLIGLLVYFLRRAEVRRPCPACGHKVGLRAKYCEECGAKLDRNAVFCSRCGSRVQAWRKAEAKETEREESEPAALEVKEMEACGDGTDEAEGKEL